MIGDIKVAIPHFDGNICFLCREKRAAIKCSYKGCTKTWHYPCGRQDSCITQFIDQFHSYCPDHVPRTNVLSNKGCYCCVCYKPLLTDHPAKCIFSKCCLEHSKNYPERTLQKLQEECFNHSNCVQRYVVNAGYDSQCINCPMDDMSKKEWQNQMRRKGIFVPMRMAVWEDDDYFKQQIKNKCGNEKCKTPSITRNVWTCFICGCFPLHLKCAGVTSHEEYLCPKCINQSFVDLALKSQDVSPCCSTSLTEN